MTASGFVNDLNKCSLALENGSAVSAFIRTSACKGASGYENTPTPPRSGTTYVYAVQLVSTVCLQHPILCVVLLHVEGIVHAMEESKLQRAGNTNM